MVNILINKPINHYYQRGTIFLSSKTRNSLYYLLVTVLVSCVNIVKFSFIEEKEKNSIQEVFSFYFTLSGEAPLALIGVLSRLLCKIFLIQFLEIWKVVSYFSYRV